LGKVEILSGAPANAGTNSVGAKSKNVFGGIVANTDERNYNGRWVYFTENSKRFKKGEFKNWMDLEL